MSISRIHAGVMAAVLVHVSTSGVSLAADPAASQVYVKGERLEEVVISASPLLDARYQATIVSSVDHEQALLQGGAQLADALANEPGVTGTNFAAGSSRPVIRGFDAQRVRVLEDGIGSFDVSDVGADHGVPVDPLASQRIEVVRGAATLRYGSQAIGGVVNSINNRVPTALSDKPVSGEVNGAYGSAANSGEGAALVDARAGQFGLHADGFDRQAQDYDIPGGTQPNSFFHGWGYSLGSSYFFGDNRVGAAVMHYDAQYGIPSDTTYIDMRQTKEIMRSSFAVNAGALHTVTVDGGYAEYEHNERDPSGVALSTFKNQEWDGRAEGLFGAVGPLDAMALGVQAQQRNFSALGDGQNYLLPTTTRSIAGFMFAEVPFSPSWRMQAGARVENVSIAGTPASGNYTTHDFIPVSASAGLVFDFSQATRLGLTLSSAARAPSQTELYARGPHDAPGTYETGDPNLVVERSNSIEATIRTGGAATSFEGSLWLAKFDNYIYGALTGRTCDDDGVCSAGGSGGLKELNYVQTGATFRGFEAKLKHTLLESGSSRLAAELIGDYVRATLAGGGNVPRMPPWHAGARIHWEGVAIEGGVLYKYSGRQDDIATAETPTAGFGSLDAHFSIRPLAGYPAVVLTLAGLNLTNTEQRNSVALNKDDVVQPGRNVRLIASARF